MTIVNISLDSVSLSRIFSSQTIAMWCIDTCHTIIDKYELPDNTEDNNISDLRYIVTELRKCIIEVERFTGPVISRMHDVKTLCITF